MPRPPPPHTAHGGCVCARSSTVLALEYSGQPREYPDSRREFSPRFRCLRRLSTVETGEHRRRPRLRRTFLEGVQKDELTLQASRHTGSVEIWSPWTGR